MASQLGPKSEFTSSARNQFFANLKPICIEISRLALQGNKGQDKTVGAKRLQELLNQLIGVLEDQIQYDATVLDDKIADYVFFPLSHLLRQHETHPIRVIESVIKSLRLLIQHGWKSRISKDLSQQLLILLTFIVGGVPGKEESHPMKPEETIREGYRALTALIKAAGLSAKDSPLTDADIIPSFGHSVSVILDGVTGGRTPEIQVEAMRAVLAVYTTIKQDDVLATFFPGTVSSLARVLSPPLSTRAQRRVLVNSINILRVVLTEVLGDLKLRNLLRQTEEDVSKTDDTGKDDKGEGKVLTASWLRATAAQVKTALSTVLKLRNHTESDVLRAMDRLCITLLDECHSTLSECTSMLVESAIMLREEHGEHPSLGVTVLGDEKTGFYGTSLEDLATIYPELLDSINATVYSWITGLPRVMQSSDERVKQRAIRNMIKGNELVSALQIHSSNLQESLCSALRDSVVSLILNSKNPKVQNEVDVDENFWRSTGLIETSKELRTYRPILLPQQSQRDTRKDVANLIQHIGSSSQQVKLANEMLPCILETTGVDQISAFWLSFELIKSSFTKNSEVDDLLDLTDAVPDPEDAESVFNELYCFSVSILDAHSDATTDEVDWRLEAIALEVTAFAGHRLGPSFRPELIDVLYPVATFLGSPIPELKGHAIATLNNLAASCGYGSVSELIIDNVDYMVNSVSLRLNQFDISPASTKVLTMMIRLTGPSLLPFLDDVVAGIFAALDSYHGYSAFVESLFGVLSEVVEQGVKSDRLLIEDGRAKVVNHRKRPLGSSGIEDTLAILDRRARRKREQEEEEDVEEIVRDHPKEAWKSAKDELDAFESKENGEDESEDPASNNEEVALPKTPTYTILTKITSLTQHYLTSPMPTLRKQLLDLLSKVSSALALDENTFLPLVNDVWPVIMSRLHDPEPYVVISACGALAALCESAGDFLGSRVKTEWSDGLGKWCFRMKDAARKSSKNGGGASSCKPSTASMPGKRHITGGENGILIPVRGGGVVNPGSGLQLEAPLSRTVSSGLGRFASAAQTWDATVSLLIAILSFVRIEDDIFEQILDLLADDVLPRNEEARRALEVINADAVWLALYERNIVEPRQAPAMEGVNFAQMDKVGG
ncbi:putative heat repeat protein [Diaporthe ampelina]|uniref:Putative heat repeat protein n=1 Tax=Diaporthe ampelina TaxID=1214573 RepID=A0A0G2FQ46_9PEZI|nr:putative heat repeat protein [Diaporthe ampelina]